MRIMREARMGIAIACGLAGTAACGPTELDQDALLADRLRAARQQWEAEGPARYSVVVRRSCTNCEGGTEFATIVVHDGTRVSATLVESGDPVPAPYVALYLTVPELFDVVEEALDDDAERIIVSYDALFGYPTSIYVDRISDVLNDELGYTAHSLTALQ